MKIKEQIIHESIARINKRVKEIRRILDANPLSDIITLRQEVYPKLSKANLTDPDTMSMVKKAAAKEKRLFALARKQANSSSDLITEQVNLSHNYMNLITNFIT